MAVCRLIKVRSPYPLNCSTSVGRLHSRARGQSLVEFAIILPVLLILVAGGVDLARAYFVGIEMTNAAREASLYVAREAPYLSATAYGDVLPSTIPYSGCPTPVATSEGAALAVGCASFAGSLLSCPSNEVTWTSLNPTNLPAQASPPNPSSDSFPFSISVQCKLDLLTPLLPPSVTISSTSTSWVEQN